MACSTMLVDVQKSGLFFALRRLVRGSRLTVWFESGNFSGSRRKRTGVLLPTISQLPSSMYNLTAGYHGGTLGYEPNSYGDWQEQPKFAEPPLKLEGAADHWDHREDTDYYSQPGALFRLMTPAQQHVLCENTGRSIGGAPREIQICHIGNCLKADPAYGKGTVTALGIPLSEISK